MSSNTVRSGLMRQAPCPHRYKRSYCEGHGCEVLRGAVGLCAGHWLGMDTHDTCGITHDQPMQEGVVLTIEPGLYIPDEPEAFGPFAGLGMRIEDDVAVTMGGPEVLSAGVPVDAHEVERIVQGKD